MGRKEIEGSRLKKHVLNEERGDTEILKEIKQVAQQGQELQGVKTRLMDLLTYTDTMLIRRHMFWNK